MNLFVIGWNLDATERSRALAALVAMHEAFPSLDPATHAHWLSGHGFAAWTHHPVAALGPRRYSHLEDDALTLYSGTVVDPSGAMAAHDARELAREWNGLSERLEGHFAIARLDGRRHTLELLGDPAGIHPTYVHQRGNRWWISNSVRLLVRAVGLTSLDVEGMATFVGMYWPGGDRTLVEGVAKLPAAQRWRWRADDGPERTSYWPLADLARLKQRPFGPAQAAALADAMRAPLRVLARAFGPLQSPVTAGRDTRMVTGLVMTSGADADYFTYGTKDDADVVGAKALCARLGLPHRRLDAPSDRLVAAWDEVSRRVIQRNDGMVTLMHARSALDLPEHLDHLPVLLYGAGGERTRGKLLTPAFVLRPDAASAERAVLRMFDRGGPLVRPEARALVQAHIRRTCRALGELGFAPADVPDAFEATEHSRRWAAAQAFQRADHRDVFVPFFTRPYLYTALEIRPVDRLLESVPHHLLLYLSPDLRTAPSSTPWPPRTLAAALAQGVWERIWQQPWDRAQRLARRALHGRPPRKARSREREAVLVSQLPKWRERFLDRTDATAWQVIDRDRFERLTSGSAGEREASAQLVNLYLAGTLLAYEEDLRAWSGEGDR